MRLCEQGTAGLLQPILQDSESNSANQQFLLLIQGSQFPVLRDFVPSYNRWFPFLHLNDPRPENTLGIARDSLFVVSNFRSISFLIVSTEYELQNDNGIYKFVPEVIDL